jgi:hypothetical protein
MSNAELGDGEPSPPHVQTPADWIEVRRGFGSIDLFEDLRRGEFVTASGLNDGGFIVWRKARSGAAQEVSPRRKAMQAAQEIDETCIEQDDSGHRDEMTTRSAVCPRMQRHYSAIRSGRWRFSFVEQVRRFLA